MASNALRETYEYAEPLRRRAQRSKPNIISVGPMDYTIYLVVVILTLIGVVMVFSSSYLTAGSREVYHYDTFYFLKRQGGLALFGFLVMNVAANINYRYLQKFAMMAYVVSLGLLLFAKLFGLARNGAARWIPFPVIGQFQPSELAKAALILVLAVIISRNNDILKEWSGFFICSVLVVVMAGLSALGSLSSAIIIALIGFGMIFVASPHIMRFVVAGVGGSAGLTGALYWMSLYSDNFRGGRFNAWLNPFDYSDGYGYQAVQSWYAIASGGLFGLGIGQSRQKTFLPEAHNDIIFSIICEELGFVGAAIVLLLFGIFIWRGMRVAINAPDTFSAMVATGIVLTIASQAVINVAVVTNTIPNTGVTMPFISYGGTSLLVCLALTGILLNISRCTKET